MTQILILVTLVVWIVYDVWVYFKKGNAETESATIWRWANISPGGCVVVGVLIGHLYFQEHEPTIFSKDGNNQIIYQVGSLPLLPGEFLKVDSDGLFVPK